MTVVECRTDCAERLCAAMWQITQSQCVRWLAKHKALLGDKQRKPVALCSHFFKEVISVTEESSALQAFETMVDKNIQVTRHCTIAYSHH